MESEAPKIVGEPDKRYYVIHTDQVDAAGKKILALVEGIPDPEKPDNPDRDGRDGPYLITGNSDEIWALILANDIVWIQDAFKRYRRYDPRRAERTRSGGV